eukprot:TRINITY_DN7311_c1_g1_i1.p2 TRINITY_DN7311_c1_g1~~TRINITY_DN7311_c1_g1_i1.p2  ORF type:complete len:209 (-),score=9.54 TRINITY_DN7311_c1_g1_i1:130-756(-)
MLVECMGQKHTLPALNIQEVQILESIPSEVRDGQAPANNQNQLTTRYHNNNETYEKQFQGQLTARYQKNNNNNDQSNDNNNNNNNNNNERKQNLPLSARLYSDNNNNNSENDQNFLGRHPQAQHGFQSTRFDRNNPENREGLLRCLKQFQGQLAAQFEQKQSKVKQQSGRKSAFNGFRKIGSRIQKTAKSLYQGSEVGTFFNIKYIVL